MPFVVQFVMLRSDTLQWRLLNWRTCRWDRVGSYVVRVVALALLVGLAAPRSALADVDIVRLEDGSVLKGEILRVENDELVIDTEYADEVTIEVKYVVGVESTRRFTVRLMEGEKVTGTLTVSPERKLVIQESREMERRGEPSLGPVHTEGEFPPPEALAHSEGERVMVTGVARTAVNFDDVDWVKQEVPYLRYKGDLNVGAQASRGNTDTTDLHLDAALEPSFGWNTIELSGEFDRKEAEGVTTTDRWRAQGRYTREIGRRWLATVLNSYEQDRQRELDLRFIAGAGPGYKFFDKDPTYLKVLPAIAYVSENFAGHTEDRKYSGFVWALEFERDLYKDDVSLYHDHQVIDSLKKPSNFVAQTKTGLKLDVFGNLTLSAEFQYDWDNEPAEGTQEDDSRYILKIGYEFEGDETDWWQ